MIFLMASTTLSISSLVPMVILSQSAILGIFAKFLTRIPCSLKRFKASGPLTSGRVMKTKLDLESGAWDPSHEDLLKPFTFPMICVVYFPIVPFVLIGTSAAACASLFHSIKLRIF